MCLEKAWAFVCSHRASLAEVEKLESYKCWFQDRASNLVSSCDFVMNFATFPMFLKPVSWSQIILREDLKFCVVGSGWFSGCWHWGGVDQNICDLIGCKTNLEKKEIKFRLKKIKNYF